MKKLIFSGCAFLFLIIGPSRAEEGATENSPEMMLQLSGYGLPAIWLAQRNPEKQETGRRMWDAALYAFAISGTLKETVPARRPDGGRRGFPSRHTAVAFAVAMSLAEREPTQGYWAFPLAAALGWTRIEQKRHTWAQVLAGAALGLWTGHMCGEGKWRIWAKGNKRLEKKAHPDWALDFLSTMDKNLYLYDEEQEFVDMIWQMPLWRVKF